MSGKIADQTGQKRDGGLTALNARPKAETIAGTGPGAPDDAVGPAEAGIEAQQSPAKGSDSQAMARKLQGEADAFQRNARGRHGAPGRSPRRG